ncbi:MAG: DUF2333 family protein [Rhodocyclaceae bacterium]
MKPRQSESASKTKLSGKATKVATLYHPRTWREKGLFWTLGLFIITYLIIVLVLGFVWSRSPAEFDVKENALEIAQKDPKKMVTGYVTVATTIRIAETLLHKPGGYVSNDWFPPGVYLDNMPNWEFGLLTEARDVARSLRNDFSRSQTQSFEDKDLEIAEPNFNVNSYSWMFPAAETEYTDGIEALERYGDRLAEGRAVFFTRADNLNNYLAVVDKRLGSLAQRLAAAVGQAQISAPVPVQLDTGAAEPRETTQHQAPTFMKTPWMKIDDVFFEARGYTWALLHTLRALEVDFNDVLARKNAVVSLKQIIRELENTQSTIWSPMILNGTGFGPMANHSLIMASYISRANAAIIDLRNLLQQG